MLMSLFASERKDGGGRRGAKRDMELMQRAIRTWSSGCHRAIVFLRERTRRESEVATVPRPQAGKGAGDQVPLVPWPVHRIFMGSASFMQEIELFLSRPGLMGRSCPDRHDDCVHGLRDGVSRTLAALAGRTASFSAVGSPGPVGREGKTIFGGSSHCPTGFVSHTHSHT